MDKSVENFYLKNPDENYLENYEKDHGPRLDAMIKRFNLDIIRNKSILDVGGGLGFLGKRLDKSNFYTVVDGANIPSDKKLCNGKWIWTDMDFFEWSKRQDFVHEKECKFNEIKYNYAFCLETLEHITNIYHCLDQIKKLVEPNGEIFISIPHANVTHNYIYPALMVAKENFEQFLGQMALPIIEYWLWDRGWNSHHWRLRNAPWKEAKMLYPKNESKFIGKTPIEYVNL